MFRYRMKREIVSKRGYSYKTELLLSIRQTKSWKEGFEIQQDDRIQLRKYKDMEMSIVLLKGRCTQFLIIRWKEYGMKLKEMLVFGKVM